MSHVTKPSMFQVAYVQCRIQEILHTVNVEIFAQYIFSRISRMALHARKYDVSEKINETCTERTNSYLRENYP